MVETLLDSCVHFFFLVGRRRKIEKEFKQNTYLHKYTQDRPSYTAGKEDPGAPKDARVFHNFKKFNGKYVEDPENFP